MRLNGDNVFVIGNIAILTCPRGSIAEVAIIHPDYAGGVGIVSKSDRERLDRNKIRPQNKRTRR